MLKKLTLCSPSNFPIVIILSFTGSTFSQEKILHRFSIKARPFQINGNYFFYILTTLAFLLKLITAKSKFAHLICLTSLIISPTTDDSGHWSTTFCPQYFDCPTDIMFVLFIFLFYGYGTASNEKQK
jgi:hypothetical protein